MARPPPPVPRNNFKADQAVDDALAHFFASRCFASCARQRRLLAVLVVLCWTSYCFVVWRMVSENERPDALANVTFCLLASAPMAVCMYFMCGFHRIGAQRGAERRHGAAYAVQGTFDDQRLGVNAAHHSAPSRLPQAALDALRIENTSFIGGDDVCVPLLLSETESNIEDEDAEEEEFRAEDTL